MALIDLQFRRRNARHEGRKQYTWAPSGESTMPVPISLPPPPPTDLPSSYVGPDSETKVLTVTVTAPGQRPTDMANGPPTIWSSRGPPKYGPNGYVHGKSTSTTGPTPVQPQSTDSLSAPTSTIPTATSSSSTSSFADGRGPPIAVKAAGGVVAMLMLCLGGILLFLFLRKRKRQRRQQNITQVPSEQTKMQDSSRPLFAPGYTPAPVLSGLGGPSVSLPAVANPTASQPVILGPIVPDAAGAYNTGIDTSDMVSLHDHHIEIENPFADPVYHTDEPPPPYRPRSVAPLSRGVSLREIPAPGVGRGVGEDRREHPRSTFGHGVNP